MASINNHPVNVNEVRDTLRRIQKNLECPICLDLLSDPYTTQCSHPFCRMCIYKVISSTQEAKCPLCKETITKRSLNENRRLGEIVEAVKDLEQAIIRDSGMSSTPPRPHPSSSHTHEATGTPGIIMHSLIHPTPVKPHPSLEETPTVSTRPIMSRIWTDSLAIPLFLPANGQGVVGQPNCRDFRGARNQVTDPGGTVVRELEGSAEQRAQESSVNKPQINRKLRMKFKRTRPARSTANKLAECKFEGKELEGVCWSSQYRRELVDTLETGLLVVSGAHHPAGAWETSCKHSDQPTLPERVCFNTTTLPSQPVASTTTSPSQPVASTTTTTLPSQPVASTTTTTSPSQPVASTTTSPSQPVATTTTSPSQPVATTTTSPSQPVASTTTSPSQPVATTTTSPSQPVATTTTSPSQPVATTTTSPSQPVSSHAVEAPPTVIAETPNLTLVEDKPDTAVLVLGTQHGELVDVGTRPFCLGEETEQCLHSEHGETPFISLSISNVEDNSCTSQDSNHVQSNNKEYSSDPAQDTSREYSSNLSQDTSREYSSNLAQDTSREYSSNLAQDTSREYSCNPAQDASRDCPNQLTLDDGVVLARETQLFSPHSPLTLESPEPVIICPTQISMVNETPPTQPTLCYHSITHSSAAIAQTGIAQPTSVRRAEVCGQLSAQEIPDTIDMLMNPPDTDHVTMETSVWDGPVSNYTSPAIPLQNVTRSRMTSSINSPNQNSVTENPGQALELVRGHLTNIAETQFSTFVPSSQTTQHVTKPPRSPDIDSGPPRSPDIDSGPSRSPDIDSGPPRSPDIDSGPSRSPDIDSGRNGSQGDDEIEIQNQFEESSVLCSSTRSASSEFRPASPPSPGPPSPGPPSPGPPSPDDTASLSLDVTSQGLEVLREQIIQKQREVDLLEAALQQTRPTSPLHTPVIPVFSSGQVVFQRKLSTPRSSARSNNLLFVSTDTPQVVSETQFSGKDPQSVRSQLLIVAADEVLSELQSPAPADVKERNEMEVDDDLVQSSISVSSTSNMKRVWSPHGVKGHVYNPGEPSQKRVKYTKLEDNVIDDHTLISGGGFGPFPTNTVQLDSDDVETYSPLSPSTALPDHHPFMSVSTNIRAAVQPFIPLATPSLITSTSPVHTQERVTGTIYSTKMRLKIPQNQQVVGPGSNDKLEVIQTPAVRLSLDSANAFRSPGGSSRNTVSFVGSGLSRPQLQQAQLLARRHGGRIASVFNGKTTHVIVLADEQGLCPRTVKYLLGVVSGLWIISYQWVTDSKAAGKLLLEEQYEVKGDSTLASQSVCIPAKARLGLDQEGCGLFKGSSFFLLGMFSGLAVEQLSQLIRLGGGVVVESVSDSQTHRDGDVYVVCDDEGVWSETGLADGTNVLTSNQIIDCVSNYRHIVT